MPVIAVSLVSCYIDICIFWLWEQDVENIWLSIVFFVKGANANYELDLLFLNKDNGKLYACVFV